MLSLSLLFHLVTSHNVGWSLCYCCCFQVFISLPEMKKKKGCTFRVWTLFQRFISFLRLAQLMWMCVAFVVVKLLCLYAYTHLHSDGVHFTIYWSYIWHKHNSINSHLCCVYVCVVFFIVTLIAPDMHVKQTNVLLFFYFFLFVSHFSCPFHSLRHHICALRAFI